MIDIDKVPDLFPKTRRGLKRSQERGESEESLTKSIRISQAFYRNQMECQRKAEERRREHHKWQTETIEGRVSSYRETLWFKSIRIGKRKFSLRDLIDKEDSIPRIERAIKKAEKEERRAVKTGDKVEAAKAVIETDRLQKAIAEVRRHRSNLRLLEMRKVVDEETGRLTLIEEGRTSFDG